MANTSFGKYNNCQLMSCSQYSWKVMTKVFVRGEVSLFDAKFFNSIESEFTCCLFVCNGNVRLFVYFSLLIQWEASLSVAYFLAALAAIYMTLVSQ